MKIIATVGVIIVTYDLLAVPDFHTFLLGAFFFFF